MTLVFGGIGFLTPWVLAAAIALPVLWMVLRATPPAPVRRFFPAVVLLLGLKDTETVSDRTPLWLLILRMLAMAALIVGFSGPVLNPSSPTDGTRPLLILRDGGWPSAPVWQAEQDRITQALERSALHDRAVAVVSMSGANDTPVVFTTAQFWTSRVATMAPAPARAGPAQTMDWITAQAGNATKFDTLWISDGLQHGAHEALRDMLQSKGDVTVFAAAPSTLALRPVTFDGADITVSATRSVARGTEHIAVEAKGTDPAGAPAVLGTYEMTFSSVATDTSITFSMPSELRNRLTHFAIQSVPSTGATTLLDGGSKRRKVALIGGASAGEGFRLLDPLHYLRGALSPTSELITSDIDTALAANPDVIVLADVARLTGVERDIQDWVEAGGVLLRFAGPRLAGGAADMGETPLLPVQLRAGGRDLGGTMSWGAPKTLAAFDAESPFAGLVVPDDIVIRSQVLAEPSPDLNARTIAALADGTPLVTRRDLGEGQVILFHVTANAEWSNLPLSGLFVDMLDRLSITSRRAPVAITDIATDHWQPQYYLDGFGAQIPATDQRALAGAALVDGIANETARVGLYVGSGRDVAVNAIMADSTLTPVDWPAWITIETGDIGVERALGGYFVAAALILMMVDVLASSWAMGKIRPFASVAAAVFAVALAQPADAQSVDDLRLLEAVNNVVLAYVLTGNEDVDTAAQAGLYGLGVTLFQRTAVEPIDPIAVNIETDELAVYPFIYWPIVASMPVPSQDAYRKINAYLRNGGMIVFDTRDDGLGVLGDATKERRHLRRIALGLDIPPLAPIPSDHVLTRAFYLLQDFPGRYAGGTVWVEARTASIENDTTRNQNDGVTPVVVGGADWVSAWAMDDQGRPLYAVGRGNAGERQREIARRFGVNLIMHVFSGNYKTDQVHLPALLERLGE